MNDQGNYRQCAPDGDRTKVYLDVPPTLLVPHTDYIPSGCAVERLYLTGKGQRSGSTLSWWVPLASWFIVGIVVFGAVMPALPMVTILEAILLAIVVLTPLVLLWHGLTDKLSASGHQD